MSYTTKARYCASCANWGGARKVNMHGAAETAGPDTIGKCFVGAQYNPCAAHGSTCGKYQKWSAVK